MAGRRLCYLAVLEGCLVFYVAYREWFSWLALLAVLGLPVLSLLVSLPAMLTVRTRLHCPVEVTAGTPVHPELEIACKLPAPPVHCRLQVRHCISGSRQMTKPEKPLHTGHCGTQVLQMRDTWVCDYLGLWQLPVRKQVPHRLTVLPVPEAIQPPPGLDSLLATAWKPKPGGYAENHELREYRPGDELRQIHWKLSAKTGTLIYREPMEPKTQKLLVTMVLSGSPEELDRKLGQLLWLSGYLLEKQLPHELRCLTGRGVEAFWIRDTDSQQTALRTVLGAPAAREREMPQSLDAAWQFHIGGGHHEAD